MRKEEREDTGARNETPQRTGKGHGEPWVSEGAYRRESPVVESNLLRLCQISLINKVRGESQGGGDNAKRTCARPSQGVVRSTAKDQRMWIARLVGSTWVQSRNRRIANSHKVRS